MCKSKTNWWYSLSWCLWISLVLELYDTAGFLFVGEIEADYKRRLCWINNWFDYACPIEVSVSETRRSDENERLSTIDSGWIISYLWDVPSRASELVLKITRLTTTDRSIRPWAKDLSWGCNWSHQVSSYATATAFNNRFSLPPLILLPPQLLFSWRRPDT